jgi:regulatory protein YycH of two-component signal transduction system YycFG
MSFGRFGANICVALSSEDRHEVMKVTLTTKANHFIKVMDHLNKEMQKYSEDNFNKMISFRSQRYFHYFMTIFTYRIQF